MLVRSTILVGAVGNCSEFESDRLVDALQCSSDSVTCPSFEPERQYMIARSPYIAVVVTGASPAVPGEGPHLAVELQPDLSRHGELTNNSQLDLSKSLNNGM